MKLNEDAAIPRNPPFWKLKMERLSDSPGFIIFVTSLLILFVKIRDVSARIRRTCVWIYAHMYDSLTIPDGETAGESATFGCRRKFGCHLSPQFFFLYFLYFPFCFCISYSVVWSAVSLKQWTRAVQRLRATETAENGNISYNNLLLKKYISQSPICLYIVAATYTQSVRKKRQSKGIFMRVCTTQNVTLPRGNIVGLNS